MSPTLKLPTLDHQVPRDVAVAVEQLRRAHETVQTQLQALDAALQQVATGPPGPTQLLSISRALSSGGAAPVNVSGSTGTLPPSPKDPTVYLNGARFPAFAKVEDAHLLLKDITTNNVTEARHGFMPTLSGNPDEVFNGEGAWVLLPVVPVVTGFYAPVTNGDPRSPELLFDAHGEVIMAFELF